MAQKRTGCGVAVGPDRCLYAVGGSPDGTILSAPPQTPYDLTRSDERKLLQGTSRTKRQSGTILGRALGLGAAGWSSGGATAPPRSASPAAS